MVSFADSVRVIQPLTDDASAIETAINSTTPKGATSLYNALYVSLKQFGRGASADGRSATASDRRLV